MSSLAFSEAFSTVLQGFSFFEEQSSFNPGINGQLKVFFPFYAIYIFFPFKTFDMANIEL